MLYGFHFTRENSDRNGNILCWASVSDGAGACVRGRRSEAAQTKFNLFVHML